MTETQLKLKVLRMIKKEFPHIWITKIDSMAISGLPDLLICGNSGHLTAIELKVGKNEPTKLQLHTLQKIREAGGSAAVCYSVDEVRKFLQKGGE